MDANNGLDTWAIVELFGHSRTAGRVTEETIAGGEFLRVDVPEVDGQVGFTKFYGASAIYSITPVSEEVARLALKRMRPEPINVYLPELKQLPRVIEPEDGGYDGDEGADDDGYGHDSEELPF